MMTLTETFVLKINKQPNKSKVSNHNAIIKNLPNPKKDEVHKATKSVVSSKRDRDTGKPGSLLEIPENADEVASRKSSGEIRNDAANTDSLKNNMGNAKDSDVPIETKKRSERKLSVSEVDGWYGLVTSGLELHEAASLGDYDTLEELLASGKFDVNLVDIEWENRTALHWASVTGFVECMRLLIDNGARPNARTIFGQTPAHLAAEAGKLTSLRALYNTGVCLDRPDAYGATPKRLALIHGNLDCVDYLKQHELDIKEQITLGTDFRKVDADYDFVIPLHTISIDT